MGHNHRRAKPVRLQDRNEPGLMTLVLAGFVTVAILWGILTGIERAFRHLGRADYSQRLRTVDRSVS